MKKTLFLTGGLLLGIGTSFAAPTPELLENLTNQILEQQTQTKTAKEVLSKLKPIFTQCASSHKDKTIQAVCSKFLKAQYPLIKKKWEMGNIPEIEIFDLGKLSAHDRLGRIGIPEYKQTLKKRKSDYPIDKFEYRVINLKKYGFSLFTPHIDLGTISEQEKKVLYGIIHMDDCSQFIKNLKKHIEKTQGGTAKNYKQTLDNTRCYNNLRIRNDISKKVVSFHDSIFSRFSEKKLADNQTFEDIIISLEKDIYPSTMFFNTSGEIVYPGSSETLEIYLKDMVELGYKGDLSPLTKKTIGVGKNLETMLKNGDAKIAFRYPGVLLIRLKSQPSIYYSVSLGSLEMIFGGYSAIDINNPDGSSSFLSK